MSAGLFRNILAALAGTVGAGGASLVGFDGTTLDQVIATRQQRCVDTVAQVRALNPAIYKRAFALGWGAARDGGGGPYAIDASDTTTADNGGSVLVGTDGQTRWKLSVVKSVSVKQFGAVGDGVTDDSNAFKAALASGYPVDVPPSASGYVCKGLVLKSGMSLTAPERTTIIASDTFAFVGGQAVVTDVIARNLVIDMRTATNTASAAFVFQASQGRQWRVVIEDCDCVGGFALARQDSDLANAYVFDSYFTRCRHYFCRGSSFLFFNLQGFVVFTLCQADHTDDATALPNLTGTFTSTQKTFPGFSVNGTAQTSVGAQFVFCSTHGRGGAAGATNAQHGLSVSNCKALTVANLYGDTINGTGMVLNNVSLSDVRDVYAQACGGGGINVQNTQDTRINGVRAVGTKGLGVGDAAQRGIYINNCVQLKCSNLTARAQSGIGMVIANNSNCKFQAVDADGSGSTGILYQLNSHCQLNEVQAYNNAGDGLQVDSCSYCQGVGFELYSNTGWGRHDTSTTTSTNYNTWSGGMFYNNTAGSVSQLGAGSVTSSYIPTSGTPAAAALVGVQNVA